MWLALTFEFITVYTELVSWGLRGLWRLRKLNPRGLTLDGTSWSEQSSLESGWACCLLTCSIFWCWATRGSVSRTAFISPGMFSFPSDSSLMVHTPDGMHEWLWCELLSNIHGSLLDAVYSTKHLWKFLQCWFLLSLLPSNISCLSQCSNNFRRLAFYRNCVSVDF